MPTKIKWEPLYKDLLFKEALTHVHNREVLINFIASMTDFKEEYLQKVPLEVNYESALTKTRAKDKGYRGDITIKFANYIINLESYSYFDKLALEKTLSYIFRIYSTSLDRGEPYEKQESIIQINIVDNVHTNISNELISNYALINTKDLSNRLLSDKLIIKFYRLDKVEDKLYNENDKVLKWLKFIKANDYEERKKVAKGDKLLMEFNNWLERYLNDEETQKIYGKWNAKIDRNTGYFFGEKDGFAKGEKENQIEVATKMLKDNMPIKDIMKYTQLTEEEINTLEE